MKAWVKSPVSSNPGYLSYKPTQQGDILCGPGHQKFPEHITIYETIGESLMGESAMSLSPVCWTVYWLRLWHQKALPSWSTCLVQGTQEDGQVWLQMGKAQAMHGTYSTFFHSLWSSPAAAALQRLLKDCSFHYHIFPVLQSTIFYLLPIHTEHSNGLPFFNPFPAGDSCGSFPCLVASFFFIG